MKLSYLALGCVLVACGGQLDTSAPSASETTSPTEPAPGIDAQPKSPSAPAAKLSRGCAKSDTTSGDASRTVSVAGRDRTFTFSAAARDANARTPRSLVFVLHDEASDPAGVRAALPVEKNLPGAIFVYPQAASTWDASGDQDLAFIDAAVEALGADLCFLENRVFATGIGAGATFANHLGCQRASIVRAIAPIAGAGPASAPCRGPVAVWQSNDASNPKVAADEGRASFEHWLRQNRCAATEAVGACVEGKDCSAGFPVTYCETKGIGHAVPDFAALHIATFFARFAGDSVEE